MIGTWLSSEGNDHYLIVRDTGYRFVPQAGIHSEEGREQNAASHTGTPWIIGLLCRTLRYFNFSGGPPDEYHHRLREKLFRGQPAGA